jgi:hypothetical protein
MKRKTWLNPETSPSNYLLFEDTILSAPKIISNVIRSLNEKWLLKNVTDVTLKIWGTRRLSQSNNSSEKVSWNSATNTASKLIAKWSKFVSFIWNSRRRRRGTSRAAGGGWKTGGKSMPDESVHQFDCLAERDRFEVHLWSWRFRCYTGHITREPMASSEPPNSRSMRLGEHVMRLNWRLSQEMPEKRHNGQDVIWFSKNENERNESLFFIDHDRSAAIIQSRLFLIRKNKGDGRRILSTRPSCCFPSVFYLSSFFPQDSSSPPGRLSCVREYLGRSIKRQLRHAVWIVSLLSNWRFDRHLHTNVFLVSFSPVVKLVKGSNFVGWLTMSRAFLQAPWSHQSIQVGENRFELLFSQMGENTTHCSCLPEEEGEERRSMSALTFLRQSWVGTRPGITSKNSI